LTTVLRRRRAVIECVHNLRRDVASCADAGVDVAEMRLLLRFDCELSYPSSVQSLSLAGSIRGTSKLVPRQSREWLRDRDLVSAVTIVP